MLSHDRASDEFVTRDRQKCKTGRENVTKILETFGGFPYKHGRSRTTALPRKAELDPSGPRGKQRLATQNRSIQPFCSVTAA